MHRIAIFGGTFDPIHNGHLKVSTAIQAYFNFDKYVFLPCKSPMLKKPTLANSQQRVDMIQLAIQDQPFTLDLREIQRDTPSYMVETLASFRAEYPKSSLTLILGYDAFLSLEQWHQWEKLSTFAHLLVINRVGFSQKPIPKQIKKLLKEKQIQDKTTWLQKDSGTIFLFNAGHYDLSSTWIRQALKKGVDVQSELPPLTYEYIKNQGLYQ